MGEAALGEVTGGSSFADMAAAEGGLSDIVLCKGAIWVFVWATESFGGAEGLSAVRLAVPRCRI
ncbi:MAG: hypothetical protein PVS2B2_22280 [Candidatus Acidiferrum sp.]